MIALILIVINIASYSSSPEIIGQALLENNGSCNIVFEEINRTAEYRFGGKSLSGTRIETWYYMKGCRGEEIYVRVYRIQGHTPKHAIILIHDYGSNYLSLTSLALNLVDEKYLVVTLDLPYYDLTGRIKVLSKEPMSSWIYTATCNIMKAVTLIQKEYDLDKIGLLGISFGGIAALLATYYDERIDYVVSIGGLGGYVESIEKASILNYYIEGIEDINNCLDPLPLMKNIKKDVLLIMGSNDEVFPLDTNTLAELVRNKHISISIVPNSGHFRIPSLWEKVIHEFITSRELNSNGFGESDVDVENTGFDILVEVNGNSSILVMHRPSIPGYPWSTSNLSSGKARFTYLLVPGEYFILKGDNYVLCKALYTRESYGLIIGLILFIIWLILDRRILMSLRRLNWLEIIYGIVLVLLLTYPLYPAIWGVDRFHASLLQIAETYLTYLPFVTYLITYSLYIQPILFTYMIFRRSRKIYMLYLALPIFTTVTSTTLILFLGSRFYYTPITIPTIPLLLVVVAMVMDYIFSETIPS